LLKSRGFWIGIVVSAIFIALFVRGTDFAEVKDAFENANYWWILASLPVYFAGLWLRTVRWQYLLRPVKRVEARRLYPVVIVGLMANNLMPARTGELVRAYVVGVRERISKSAALGTIAIDRLFDGLTLVPMMVIVAIFAGQDVSRRLRQRAEFRRPLDRDGNPFWCGAWGAAGHRIFERRAPVLAQSCPQIRAGVA
jgi:uncharacterized protein (TIRG00374 family)